jgi:hypothetical protein
MSGPGAPKASRAWPGIDRWQALQLAGIVAAVVLAAVVNVVAARHFTRWDWTRDKRWSLSPATLETLRGLEARVDVWAIAGPGDPLEQSLRQLLVAYQVASPRLAVHWIDPDRDAVQLVDLQRRFGLEAGRSEDGRVATDAVVILAGGDKHWFLTTSDLVEVSDDAHARPHEERAITLGLRSVLGGDKPRLCFTVGHGELSLEPGKDPGDWLGGVRDLMEKNNYDLTSVDATEPDMHEPFEGCALVVVAGPRAAFGADESNRLRTWLLRGGRLLAAIGPIEGNTDTGLASAGLDPVLSPFGIALDDDVVHDPTPATSIPDTHAEGFFVTSHPHPVTAALVVGGPDDHPPRVAAFYARSMRHVAPPGATPAMDLLTTGDGAFAKKSVVGAASWGDLPPRDPGDLRGPFTLAMAGDRGAGGGARAARVVVVGSRFALAEDNWRQPRPLHGMAFFVDSAVSWLVARPAIVDVPERAEVPAGMRVSEEGRSEVRRYVLVLMPLAAALLGFAVWAWRRSMENRPYPPAKGRGTS